MQNYYWNCLRDSDRHLMRLLNTLDEAGDLDNTIIVFTSDHGEMLGTHGIRGKGTFAGREQSRVPMTVVHPTGRRGVECDELGSHVDLARTLLSLIGVPPEQVREQLPMLIGHDLAPFVFDATGPTREAILLHWTAVLYQNHQGVARFNRVRSLDPADRLAAVVEIMNVSLRSRGQMRGAYDGRFKFQRYGVPFRITQPATWDALQADYDLELFDTVTDPGETTNLASEPGWVDRWRPEIERMNALTNQLIAAEVGVDDGAYVPTFGIEF